MDQKRINQRIYSFNQMKKETDLVWLVASTAGKPEFMKLRGAMMGIPDTIMGTYKDVEIQITFIQVFKDQWLIGLSVNGKHVPTPLTPFPSRQAAFHLGVERARSVVDTIVVPQTIGDSSPGALSSSG